MAVWVTSGPAAVVAQGAVCTFLGNPLVIEAQAHLGTVRVEMVFRKDESVEGPKAEWEAEPNGMRLVLVNFDSPDGHGTAEPAIVAVFDNEVILLHFRVTPHRSGGDHWVTYVLYSVPRSLVPPEMVQ